MRERASFFSGSARSLTSGGVSRRLRTWVLPLVATLFLVAPAVAAADDGSLPLVPVGVAPPAATVAVAEALSAVPAVNAAPVISEPAAAAAVALAEPTAAAAAAVPAAIAPDKPVERAAEAVSVPASAPAPEPAAAPAAAPAEQYRPGEDRYQGATAPRPDEKPAPGPRPAAGERSETARAGGETPPPQFIWNWVWHCAPTKDTARIELPQNLPENAIINWVWDSSCAPADADPLPDQYQDGSPQYHQQNILVSIRVNSPGDDGAITQTNLAGGRPGTGVRAPPAGTPAVPIPTPVAAAPVPLPTGALPLALVPVAFPAVPIPLPIVPVPMPVMAAVVGLANPGSAVAALAEPAVLTALERAAPQPKPRQGKKARRGSPALPAAASRPSFAQPAVWVTAPERPSAAAKPRHATRARSRAATPNGRIPSGPNPLDSLPMNAAGAASGGAGGSSGLLLSAVVALLAAYVLWPPFQWTRVVSVAGGLRKRVDGGRLERPG